MKSFNFYKITSLIVTLALALSTSYAQDCGEDIIAPVAVCESNLQVAAIEDYGALIWAFDIDEGSFDQCSAVDLYLTTPDDDTGTAPTTNSVLLPAELGTYEVILYAVDQAGNENTCWANVTVAIISDNDCPGDDEAPEITCIEGITTSLNPSSALITAVNMMAMDSPTDNCTPSPALSINLQSESTGIPQGHPSITFDEVGTYWVEVWAMDNLGNNASCVTWVQINGSPDCEEDVTAPIPICVNGLTVTPFAGEELVVWGSDFDAGSYDNCSPVEFRIVRQEESTGSLPTTQSITIPSVAGIYPVEVWIVDASGNTNFCVTNLEIIGVYHGVIGQVYLDDNDNCVLDAEEEDSGFGGWEIRITDSETGMSNTEVTQAFGGYEVFLVLPDDNPRDILVEVLLPDGVATGCSTSFLLENYDVMDAEVDFALGLVENCNYLTVDVASPFLRRCFPNDIRVQYNNASSVAVEDVFVELQLDAFLAIQSASLPYQALGNNLYRFELGTVAPAFTGFFTINALLSCEAELGATHCMTAMIEPFSCTPQEGFAELTITGECDEGSGEVQFTVRNTGTSNMSGAQEVRIVEDVIMYMNGNPLQLDAGEEEEFNFPANGATWRLEIPQDGSFPYGGIAAAFVEGCGGFNQGIATQFELSSNKPNFDQLCLENIGAYDPNDKQALPKGYGAAHYIEANTPLEYLIRFQNTGTDTAFNIRIDDQLSEYLDPSTLVPGASSHPYRVELKDEGLLSFHFDNIMLPDSNVNLAGSNGFVQFSIQQLADNPLNTIIENTAGIYFDFNDPVITNTVWHTIGEDFILVQSHEVLQEGLALRIAPNPVQTYATITLEGTELQIAWCTIYDSQGRMVTELTLDGNTARIDRELLPQDGLYFFRIRSANELLAQGKLIAQ